MPAATPVRRGRCSVIAAALLLGAGVQIAVPCIGFVSLAGRLATRSSRTALSAMRYDEAQVGEKYTGTVRSIASFGAFVDFGADADGLVHISQIADSRVNDVRDYLKEGQEVEVWLKQKKDRKFGLTMVESKLSGGGGGAREPVNLSPFEGMASDVWVKGTVVSTTNFGAFVKVTAPKGGATAQGLVHITQIQDGFVESVADVLQIGQEVQVRVTSVDVGAGKMSLSMKEEYQPREPDDLSAFEGIPSDQWLTGKVVSTPKFGAFVEVTAPKGGATAQGLVHITQIQDGFVESVADVLQMGQEVQVRVTSVDVGAGKMSLSMKEEGGEGEEE